MITYKAIIFDLGGVLINVSMDKIFNYLTKASDYDINLIKQKFVSDEVFHQFERGEIEPEDYRKYVSRKLELRISEDEFYNVWNDIFHDLDPRIEQLLIDLKSRFRLVVLTNTNEIHANKWKIKYASILNNFERIFCSYEIHSRKPERKAYEIVLNYLKIEPNCVLFLDDKLENVKIALEIGMKGILVKSTDQMITELNKLGIAVL